ncbi:unnamed protein product [Effrenium voratum]|nr:unnamed protein product [Effrenium voratum]
MCPAARHAFGGPDLHASLAVASLRQEDTSLARNTGRYLNANESVSGSCELCGLDWDLTVHHLVPKLHWRRMRKRRQVTGKDEPPTAILCRTCHSMVHRTFSHSELGRCYNSIEALEEASEMQGYLQSRRPWGKARSGLAAK